MLFCILCTSFCVDVCIPRSGTVGSCIKCMVNFVRSCQAVFLKVNVPFFIPTSSVWDFQLFPILVSLFGSTLGNFLKFIIQLFCRAFISSVRLSINFQELFCFVNVLFRASCSYLMGATFPFVSLRIWLFLCSYRELAKVWLYWLYFTRAFCLFLIKSTRISKGRKGDYKALFSQVHSSRYLGLFPSFPYIETAFALVLWPHFLAPLCW